MGLTVPILTGRWVRLEPLGEEHRGGLRPAADDPRLWEHTLTRGDGPHFDGWFAEAVARRADGSAYPFAVRRLEDDQLVGSTSYLDIALPDRRVEIGSTWYVPAVWGTRVNPECKLLLLAHAFEVLGVNRVALVTDARNERSQRAIAGLGAVREGVLRSHRITQGGRVRDTVVFSVIAPEWPAVRDRLNARLAGDDPAGG